MDKDKIVVLGTGMVASAFKRKGYTVWGRDEFEWRGPNHPPEYLRARIRGDIDCVINTIGISDTRFCEDPDNFDLIKSVNGDLPGYLSRQCRGFAEFVHISTGCLYDTKDIPQKETAFKSAHCNYVISKWIGELGCDESNIIIRPRLIFDSHPPAEGKRNNLLCKLPEFTEFLSEYNTVTSCDTIIEAVQALLDGKATGIFNVGQTGQYTIADMARAIGLTVEKEICEEELHNSERLYLVNNLMHLSKLKKYYTPRNTLVEDTDNVATAARFHFDIAYNYGEYSSNQDISQTCTLESQVEERTPLTLPGLGSMYILYYLSTGGIFGVKPHIEEIYVLVKTQEYKTLKEMLEMISK